MPVVNRYRQRSSSTTTTTTSSLLEKNAHLKKAKCAENQEALDRLMTKLIEAQTNENVNYCHTLRRAMKSIKDCPHAITCQTQALKLKGVGQKMASIVCPSHSQNNSNNNKNNNSRNASSREATSSVRAQGQATKRKRQTSTTTTAASKANKNVENVVTQQEKTEKQMAYESACHAARTISENLPSGDWRVVLLVDGREHYCDRIISKLSQAGVPCLERHLPIGDMAWIAKSQSIELLLGTIIERKEVSDLVSSLFGTRYSEQWLRLSQSGMDHVVLLVEGNVRSVPNCPPETLKMAMMESRIQYNFQVVETRDMTETVQILKAMHRRILQQTFPTAFCDSATSLPSFASPSSSSTRGRAARKRRTIRKRGVSLQHLIFDVPPVSPRSAPFITYDQLKCKVELDRQLGARSVRAIYMSMLKQVASISDKKVVALARAYPNLDSLMRAEGRRELEEITLQNNGATTTVNTMRLGPKSAMELCHAFGIDDNNDVNGNTTSNRKSKATKTATTASTNANVATNTTASMTTNVAKSQSRTTVKNPYHDGKAKKKAPNQSHKLSKRTVVLDLLSPEETPQCERREDVATFQSYRGARQISLDSDDGSLLKRQRTMTLDDNNNGRLRHETSFFASDSDETELEILPPKEKNKKRGARKVDNQRSEVIEILD